MKKGVINNQLLVKIIDSKLMPVFLMGTGLIAVMFAYWNGLNGDFMFDDFPTLETLGDFNGVRNWETFLFYLDSGHAGPTGRPISMLSFLLNATNWPAEPYSFKLTNLVLHLICGILISIVINHLLAISSPEFSSKERAYIALLASFWWLLNPFHVSTTLYVVQRMTQLATFFTLLGFLCYLYGRRVLNHSPKIGYVWMSFAIVGMGSLALLSKENGALLPVLILLTEIILIQQKTKISLAWQWKLLFLWTPTFLIAGYLVWIGYQFSTIDLSTRNFSLNERLLTESRVIWHYLYNLVIPRLEGGNFFGDDLQSSNSLISPWSTLFATLGLIVAIILCWINRARYPLLAFSILFFLAAHLLESTTIPLELYFEHRNYLPSIFLALSASSLTVRFFQIRPLTAISAGLLSLTLLFTITLDRATLWGETEKLYVYWALKSPDSARAQTAAIGAYSRSGRDDLAFSLAETAVNRNPGNLLLHLQWISFIRIHSATQAETYTLLKVARNAEYEEQALAAAVKMTEECEGKPCNSLETQVMHAMFNNLLQNPKYRSHVGAVKLLHHLQGRLYIVDNNIPTALKFFSQIPIDADYPETGLYQVALLATKGHYQEALQQLNKIKISVNDYIPQGMKKEYYQREIVRLEHTLQQDLQKMPTPSLRMSFS